MFQVSIVLFAILNKCDINTYNLRCNSSIAIAFREGQLLQIYALFKTQSKGFRGSNC